MIEFIWALALGLFGFVILCVAIWIAVMLGVAFYEDGRIYYGNWKRSKDPRFIKCKEQQNG